MKESTWGLCSEWKHKSAAKSCNVLVMTHKIFLLNQTTGYKSKVLLYWHHSSFLNQHKQPRCLSGVSSNCQGWLDQYLKYRYYKHWALFWNVYCRVNRIHRKRENSSECICSLTLCCCCVHEHSHHLVISHNSHKHFCYLPLKLSCFLFFKNMFNSKCKSFGDNENVFRSICNDLINNNILLSLA